MNGRSGREEREGRSIPERMEGAIVTLELLPQPFGLCVADAAVERDPTLCGVPQPLKVGEPSGHALGLQDVGVVPDPRAGVGVVLAEQTERLGVEPLAPAPAVDAHVVRVQDKHPPAWVRAETVICVPIAVCTSEFEAAARDPNALADLFPSEVVPANHRAQLPSSCNWEVFLRYGRRERGRGWMAKIGAEGWLVSASPYISWFPRVNIQDLQSVPSRISSTDFSAWKLFLLSLKQSFSKSKAALWSIISPL